MRNSQYLNFPSNSLAQKAYMSFDEYYDYWYNTIDIDYSEMGKKQEKLTEILNKGNNVHIIGYKTDLTFSIK